MVECVGIKPGGNFHLASARNVIQICEMSMSCGIPIIYYT